jgi:xanthine dehydrogenase small subunit
MTEPIRFLLDGRMRELRDVDPNTTTLEWLRVHERRCGTKEGCAEGDCGACTVVILDAAGAARAVNACIQPIGALDGRALLTVESLATTEGALDPAQRAMVECHGSQCGFCTPGFVMSLAALRLATTAPTREDTLRVLAGNLCRCTGYRPILDAAQRMYALDVDRGLATRADTLRSGLATLRRDRGLDLAARGARFIAPRDLAELASALRRHPEARLVAGASDLGLEITKQLRRFDVLIALAEIAELRGIRSLPDGIELGAAVTWAEAHAPLVGLWPALDELIARFAGLQIRNVATLGGNLANASPIGDGAPAFLALDAKLVLWRDGVERELALDNFFLGYRRTALAPGEIIKSIRLPAPPPTQRFAAYKVTKRFDSDISAICACFAVELDAGARIAAARFGFGGMAATPARARHAEAALIGRAWSQAAIRAAMAALGDDFTPIDDLRASAAYRMTVARNLLLRFWHESAGDARPARLGGHG